MQPQEGRDAAAPTEEAGQGGGAGTTSKGPSRQKATWSDDEKFKIANLLREWQSSREDRFAQR